MFEWLPVVLLISDIHWEHFSQIVMQNHTVYLIAPLMSMCSQFILKFNLSCGDFFPPWDKHTCPSPVVAVSEPKHLLLFDCQPNPHQPDDCFHHILTNMSKRFKENKGQERVVMSASDVNLCPHSGTAISSLHLTLKYANASVESWRIYSVFLGDKGTVFYYEGSVWICLMIRAWIIHFLWNWSLAF